MKNEKNNDKNKISITFGKDGINVHGEVSRLQHVQGCLAMLSSLIDRCGGDAAPVNEAISAIQEREEILKKADKTEKDCKVAKFKSLEDMIRYLEEEIGSKDEDDDEE